MTLRRGPRALLSALLGIWLLGGAALAEQLSGAAEVVDGDTLEVDGVTVRLYGIDAPELGQGCLLDDKPYDCGAVARSALLDLVAGATVTCRVLPGGAAATDAEGWPGRCFAAGYDLSEGMAHSGWALAERSVSERYVAAEEDARKARRGLWTGRFVTPWGWRGGERLSGTE